MTLCGRTKTFPPVTPPTMAIAGRNSQLLFHWGFSTAFKWGRVIVENKGLERLMVENAPFSLHFSDHFNDPQPTDKYNGHVQRSCTSWPSKVPFTSTSKVLSIYKTSNASMQWTTRLHCHPSHSSKTPWYHRTFLKAQGVKNVYRVVWTKRTHAIASNSSIKVR